MGRTTPEDILNILHRQMVSHEKERRKFAEQEASGYFDELEEIRTLLRDIKECLLDDEIEYGFDNSTLITRIDQYI